MSKRLKIKGYKGLYEVVMKNGDTVFYGMYKKPDGKRGEVSLGKKTIEFTAEHAAHELFKYTLGKKKSGHDKRLEQEQLNKEKQKTTWDGFWQAYSDHVDDNGKLNKEKSGYYGNNRIFQIHIKEYFKNIPPHKVTEEDALTFKQHVLKKPVSDGFKRNIFELFKRILRHNKNLSAVNIPLPKVKPKIKTRPTEAQVKKLMAILVVPAYWFKGKMYTVNRKIANAMLLMRYTGMRSLETRKLHWKDVDFERNKIELRDPKGGVDQTIPMSKKARQVLKKQLPVGSNLKNLPPGNEFVFKGRNGKMMSNYTTTARRYCDHAGMPKDFAPCHGLRFLYASELNDKGVPLTYIQKLLTHKNVATTMTYIGIDENNLLDAANLIV